MANADSCITIHMAPSPRWLHRRKDGSVGWLETSDEFVGGTFVLTSRQLPRIRDTIEFHSGDLARFVNGRLRFSFRNIWFVGGGVVSRECVRRGLADEVRYSILPILVGSGLSFFEKLDRDIALHLTEIRACKSGMVALRYEVRSHHSDSQNAT